MEGAEPTMITFRTYLPPDVLCFQPEILDAPIALILSLVGAIFNISAECNIQVQMSTSNYMYDMMPYIKAPILGLNIGRPK